MKNNSLLKFRSIGIDTYRENVVYLRADSHICMSEGFKALTRVEVCFSGKRIVATLNVIHSDILHEDEVSLSLEAQKRLQVFDGDEVTIKHLKTVESLGLIRAKLHGKTLNGEEFTNIIEDVVKGNFSNIELAAFISACSGDALTVEEMIGLTSAMVKVGQRVTWDKGIILDKHCIGGLPGNRTSPIVISIIAAAGLRIPKTSSRAITSPSGTADMMETITRVDLSIEEIQEVVKKENGCLAWGGAVRLSPADDVIISVEKALDMDSEGQMIASVLSKKVAAGSTHVVIDIPVGPTAKVRSQENALKLQYYFKAVGEAMGLRMEVKISDGRQPVGRGIGPALEAIDVLAVLRNDKDAPQDLRDHALVLAGMLLELSGTVATGNGKTEAAALLVSGAAYSKFKNICTAQGSFNEPLVATNTYEVRSDVDGTVHSIDNRRLAKLAKLAGAPKSPGAGIKFLAPLGTSVKKGDLLFTIYSEFPGELRYARDYLSRLTNLIKIE